ncbi:MAG: hypothetical protein II489_00920 [Bacteroidaceae bacterium]|nr:hypothetical protein [Bacteroidaceae bacterium]
MKKFMYMCMMLLAATLTFTACGSDDDDKNGGGQQQGQNLPSGEVNQDNYYSYAEIATVKGSGQVGVKGEAWFENGKCTKVQYSYILPSKSSAKQVKEYFDEDADRYGSIYYDGDKTVSYTEQERTITMFAQMEKEAVCKQVKSTVQYIVEAMMTEPEEE